MATSFRTGCSAAKPEVWPEKIEVRDADGIFLRFVNQTQAEDLISKRTEQGQLIAKTVGNHKSRHVRLLSFCERPRETSDANRTTVPLKVSPKMPIDRRIRVEHRKPYLGSSCSSSSKW